MKACKYNIDTDLGIDYRDSGRWRSYQLYASGNSEAELMEDATISEIDQDGGDLATYGLEDASNEVHAACIREIARIILEKEKQL